MRSIVPRICGAILLMLYVAGCEATPPSRLESRLMTSAKHRIFVRGKFQKNPIPTSAGSIADGKEAFSHYCAACHGYDGQNTGVPFSDRMSPPVPLLSSKEVQSYTDGQLKWVIDNGIKPSGMPGSRGTLSDDEIWSIVVYLRHLPPPGSAGEPEMYTH
jgi:mono/diheme cytochrome c family protein